MTTLNFFELADESASEALAAQLSIGLISPLVLTFSGEIGAGKTTFIRAMLRALGIKSAIKSPTFSLIESYDCQHLQIHHFDLYRIHDEVELDYIGFLDYFKDAAVCCIEWPERVPTVMSLVDLKFSLALSGAGRIIQIQANSPLGETLMTRFEGVVR